MDPAISRALRQLAFDRAGICLSEAKEAMLAARLGRRLRALGLQDEKEYLRFLRRDESGGELVEFLDVISTNFTSFFREPAHFRRLETSVRDWVAGGQRRMRLWCAASSSGEEPYSLAMALSEAIADRTVDWRILATDLSTRVLRTAMEGAYTAKQVAAIPAELRPRYLEPVAGPCGAEGPWMRARGFLKKRVVFRRLNLAETPYPMRGPLDAVFCRNVMIYLHREVRTRLVAEIERLLKPGGLLFIGHAETLTGLPTCLRPVVASVYRRP